MYDTCTYFQGIVRLILSTDMGKHSDIIANFEKILDRGIDYDNEVDRSLVSF